MWTIRQEQAEVFSRNALQKFEEEMVEHLQGFAPRLFEIRGEPTFREVIQLGIARARRYGFTNRGPVRFYIELMLTQGSDFDTDFQLPWAGDILRSRQLGDQTARADQLFVRLGDYTDHVFGPNMQYAVDALGRVELVELDPARVPGRDFESWMTTRLEMIFPQKCSYVGDAVLLQLVERAREVAATYQVTSALGIATIAGLIFGVGHGVAGDLLYPWVAATLSNPLVPDPNVRAERLYRKTLVYFEHVLADVET